MGGRHDVVTGGLSPRSMSCKQRHHENQYAEHVHGDRNEEREQKEDIEK